MNTTIKIALAGIAITGTLAGCADVQPGAAKYPDSTTIATEVEAWRSDAKPTLLGVQKAFEDVQNTAANLDVLGMEKACTTLVSEITEGYAWYVTPIGAASTEMKAAFDFWRQAGLGCQNISLSTDFNAVAADIESGTGHLNEAAAILDGKKGTS